MPDINRVQLFGRVGKDPELRYTSQGKAWVTFTMATAENYKDKGGEWKSTVEWHNVVIWGDYAEKVHAQISKGSQLFVEGKTTSRSWEKKEGGKGYITEVVASVVIPAYASEKQSGAAEPRSADKVGESQRSVTQATFSDDQIDDIPF
jgi:single-strand DNA-binding protein